MLFTQKNETCWWKSVTHLKPKANEWLKIMSERSLVNTLPCNAAQDQADMAKVTMGRAQT